jgi:general secretion pathway protein B
VSYILDALRKAERDRQVSRVPTLATAHGGADFLRRPHWAWAVAAGAVALSALVMFSPPWTPPRPDPARETPPLSAVAADPPAARASSDPAPPLPALAPAPEVPAAAPRLESGPAVERPPGAPVPARPRVSPPAKSARAAGPDDDLRPARAPKEVPPAPEPRPAAEAAAPPTRPAVVDRAPVAEVRPGAEPVVPPAAASAPAPAAGLPPAAGAARAAQPAPATPLPRLALDVLVYSEIPAERLVFINGRKYVEGQTVDGETVVEQITPDGVVLDHQGRRIMLRPKLNPYARPGSP